MDEKAIPVFFGNCTHSPVIPAEEPESIFQESCKKQFRYFFGIAAAKSFEEDFQGETFSKVSP
ncbi:MAG TPA: hypothetical protein PLQ76_06090, partial [bacterium]|nr:hypothetical protein [bacterium]